VLFVGGAILGDAPREGVGGAALSGSGRITLEEQVALWFEESRDDVYRYLLLVGLSPAQAQETVQEVFLRLFVTLKRKEEIRNYRAWAFRVAHNEAVRVRTREGQTASMNEAVVARLSAPENNPEEAVLERERMAGFRLVVQSLSEQQQRCLFLRMEGLRYPEIAGALGISASAVGEFLRRAIGRLRQAGIGPGGR
jgi:RNA polymerase sigma-70 factor, ECF subfamily